MSTKYPNVPDVPGVPAVARPDALLATIQLGSGEALSQGVKALAEISGGDISDAIGSLAASAASATGALGPAEEIYSDGSNIVTGLRGTVANASSAVSAIGSGDVRGAVAATERLVDQAQRAYRTIQSILSPSTSAASTTDADAETALENPWGLYTLEGELAAPVDTVIAFENTLDARISDYPVENGGFASYNKVITPYEIRAILTRGGTVEDRQAFLKAIQDAWTGTTLFNFVTPECVYLDVNVTGVRQQRSADRGNGLLALEVVMRKIRQTASLAFSSTKDATGQDVVNKGSVQAQPKPAVQQYAGAAG